MNRLKVELARLRESGESSLASEIDQLISAEEAQASLSRKFLALAALKIKEGNHDVGHDCIGAAVEAYHAESDNKSLEIAPHVVDLITDIDVIAAENAFAFPLPDINQDEEFKDATSETVTEFANLLVNAGFSEAARSYLTAYHTLTIEGESMTLDKKKALEEVRSFFKKNGNLAQVKAAEEMLEELSDAEDAAPAESRAADMQKEADTLEDGEAKAAMMKAGYMMRAAEEADKEGQSDEAKAMKAMAEDLYKGAKEMGAKDANCDSSVAADGAEDKPVLYVDPPSAEEDRLRKVAAQAAKRGDLVKTKACLNKARRLEGERIVAALIKAGDADMAMDVLNELDTDADKNAGLKGDGEAAADAAKKISDEEKVKTDSEMPAEEAAADEPSKEPEALEDEQSEQDMADDMMKEIQSSLRTKNLKAATASFAKLSDLEKVVVAAVKTCRDKGDKVLAKEGFSVWRDVAKTRFKAEAAIAKAEKEAEVYEQAMEGMEKLEDESMAAEELDKALEGVEDSHDSVDDEPEEIQVSEDMEVNLGDSSEEVKEEAEEAPKNEADSMSYEVLQSLDEIKAMKVSREALAFTFWEDESGSSPYYVVQASGKPVAEIHLGDQDSAEDIRAYFCDEQKYAKALAQSCENTNLYEMLRGVHARFYANEVNRSSLAKKIREEVAASTSTDRTEKLASLRKDFMDAMMVAAQALNKGIYQDKPNPLKSAFAKVLSSYGIANPAIAVESAFKDGGSDFFESVMEAAAEYLEMPKEAFKHAKKMVEQATNVAHATASNFSDMSIGERLSRNSLPLGSVQEAQEAPVVASHYDNERYHRDSLKSRLQLSRKG